MILRKIKIILVKANIFLFSVYVVAMFLISLASHTMESNSDGEGGDDDTYQSDSVSGSFSGIEFRTGSSSPLLLHARHIINEEAELLGEGCWQPIYYDTGHLEGIQVLTLTDAKDKRVQAALVLRELEKGLQLQKIVEALSGNTQLGLREKLVAPIRVIIAIGGGIFVSMIITDQVMEPAGDWLHAPKDSWSATCLTTFIATVSSFLFANQWDNRLEWIGDYLWRARGCFCWPFQACCDPDSDLDSDTDIISDTDLFSSADSVSNINPDTDTEKKSGSCRRWCKIDPNAEKKAIARKFPLTSVGESWDSRWQYGKAAVTSLVFAFPPLWQVLTSKEEEYYPVLTELSGTVFYLSWSDISFQAAISQPQPTLLTHKSFWNRVRLVNSVEEFEASLEDPDFVETVVQGVTGGGGNVSLLANQKLSLFSICFITPKRDAVRISHRDMVNQERQEAEKWRNPRLQDQMNTIKTLTNAALGIGWVYLAMLLDEEFEPVFRQWGAPENVAYWAAIGASMLQATGFVEITYDINHLITQQVREIIRNPKKRVTDYLYCGKFSNCCKNVSNCCKGFSNVVGWFRNKARDITSVASGALLSAPLVKRGLDLYNNLSWGKKIVQVVPPALLQFTFMTDAVYRNFEEIKIKILTNPILNHWLSCFPGWKPASDKAFLTMFARRVHNQLYRCTDISVDLLHEYIWHQAYDHY